MCAWRDLIHSLSLLIADGNPEDKGWFGGVVNVGRGRTDSCHRTCGDDATVYRIVAS